MKQFLLSLVFLVALATGSDAANRFAVCTVTCTWDGSSTAMWSATTGGATGASVPGTSDDVIFDAATCVGGVTCTTTVNVDVAVLSITLGACTAATTGCIIDFSVNNNSVTLSGATGLVASGTGVRTLRMGTNTWTVSNTGNNTLVNFQTITNLTYTPSTSTIKFSGSTANLRTFNTGLLTHANLYIDTNALGGGVVLSQNAVTFTNITMIAPTQFFLPQNNTVTAASLTMTGSATSQSFLGSNAYTTRGFISVASGTQTLTWIGVDGVTFSGGATFVANNSFNLGPNSGITINAPAGAFGGGGGCILGGWLLWRDLPNNVNDNFPAWLDKAA